MKIVLTLIVGLLAGAGFMYLLNRLAGQATPTLNYQYPISATLYRFKIKKGQLKTYRDWIDWHSREKGPINATMERENMYVESVFRDTINEPDFFYWLSFNGTGGESYTTSNMSVDKKHEAYLKRFLVNGARVMLKTDFLMLPPFLEKSIAEHQSIYPQ